MRKLDLEPCPFPFSSFREATGYYDCQSFSNIKGAHLKRLNANLISYMKQSWFIFSELFFLSLQTISQRAARAPPPPSTPPPLPAGIMPFNIQSKEWGSALWTLATDLQHLSPPRHPPTCLFSSSSSRYLPTAGAESSPKIAVILKKGGKYWELHLESVHIAVIRLILGKAGWHAFLSAAAVSVFVDAFFFFCGCLRDVKVEYSSQTLLLYKYCDWINRSQL